MLTRRNALAMLGALPTGTLLWSMPSFARTNAATLHAEPGRAEPGFIPDRELTLALSDNFRRQKWAYAGQHYSEERDAILVDEGEQLRVSLCNDTNSIRTVAFNNALIEIAPGETQTFDLYVDSLDVRTLRELSTESTHMIRVRPMNQSHAIIVA